MTRARKLPVGWWVKGAGWCPTEAIRDHALAQPRMTHRKALARWVGWKLMGYPAWIGWRRRGFTPPLWLRVYQLGSRLSAWGSVL